MFSVFRSVTFLCTVSSSVYARNARVSLQYVPRHLQGCPSGEKEDHDSQCCLPAELDRTGHCCTRGVTTDSEGVCCLESERDDINKCLKSSSRECDPGDVPDEHGHCCPPANLVGNHCGDHSPSETVGHKLGALAVVLIMGAAGCAMPYVFKRCCVPVLNRLTGAFSAGTFIGLAILHLFSESVAMLDEAQVGFNVNGNFVNAAYPLALTGFLMMFYLEHVIWIPGVTEQDVKLLGHHHNGDADYDSSSVEEAPPVFQNTLTSDEIPPPSAPQDGNVPTKRNVTFASVLLMLAMSVHSVFEGGVIGLAQSPDAVWISTAAIAGHKWAEGFAISNNFMQMKMAFWWKIAFLSMFVLASPVGILIGWPLAYLGNGVIGVFSAISLGTLLHVAMETLYDTFQGKAGAIQRHCLYLAFILGALILFGLWCLHMMVHVH